MNTGQYEVLVVDLCGTCGMDEDGNVNRRNVRMCVR